VAEQLLKISEVAQRLRCSIALAYALCAEGKLPHVRLGLGRGTIRVLERDLELYLEGARVEGCQLPGKSRHLS
jgi:excisionase family DNA binding protein